MAKKIRFQNDAPEDVLAVPVPALRVGSLDRGGKVAAENHQLALFLQVNF